jgi:hypothetical protein
MYLCKGYNRSRVVLGCSKFWSSLELFHKMRRLDKSVPIWLEFGDNQYQPIFSDSDLKFACQMIEGDIESNLPEEDYEQHQRDLADYAHTKRYHAERKRGVRVNDRTKSIEPKTPSGILQDASKNTETCDASNVFDDDILCDEHSE